MKKTTKTPLLEIRGSTLCKYSLLENNQEKLYKNQILIYQKLEEILKKIKK